jgi:8-oxo-dGTP pyrophosphatase MutT (NUDIX family)
MNDRLPEQLAECLAGPSPNVADPRFTPQVVAGLCAVAPPDARMAAVLLLLYPHNGQWHLPFTLRPTHLAAHAGQISLPGGAVEPGETSAEAALREFHEELGDDGQPIRMLGALTPLYVHASNYHVTPWVATVATRPAFMPNPAEVELVLEVPLDHLLDPANLGSRPREFQGQICAAPHFCWQSHQIWGATCRILGQLVTVLEGFRTAGQ